MTVQDLIPMYQAPDYVALQVEKDGGVVAEAQPVHTTTPGQWAVRVLMLLSYAVMILMNAITGPKNAAVSNEYPTRITPADYAFMIWTPLFLGVGAFVVYAFVNRGPTNPLPTRAVVGFIVNMLCNAAWGWTFTHKYALLSVFIVIGTLLSCAFMYTIVFPRGNAAFPELSVLYWCRQFVWSAYTAWEVVATLVNIEWAQQYYKIAIGNEDQNIEAVAFIVLAVLIGAYWALARQDVIALTVFLWSFIAIVVKQGEHYPCVVISCIIASVLILCLAIVTVVRRVINSPKE